MPTIYIEEDDLLDLLMNRVKFWAHDNDEYDKIAIRLYEQMYDNYIQSGVFESPSEKLDIKVIVDNDWVNNCGVIQKGDDEYDAYKKIYDNQGLGDCSCDDSVSCNFIEAYDEQTGSFLVRY